MIRIAITGPESCGKTTLAMDLSKHLNATYAAEYAREYLETREGRYSFSDLDNILLGQLNLWKMNGDILVADTELTVIKIWADDKFGSSSSLIDQHYKSQHFDHYFLCSPDIPWQPDPLREDPNRRITLFECYEKELRALNRQYTILQGSKEERIKKSIEKLQKLKLI